MANDKNIWKFRTACMAGDVDLMHQLCKEDPSYIAFENPDNLDFSILAKYWQIQFMSGTGDLDGVRQLVENDPNLVNCQWTHERNTPLLQATQIGAIEVFKYLIDKGADISLTAMAEGQEGYSVLHAAAWWGNLEAAKILLELGMDKNIRSAYWGTPLKIATDRNRKEFANYFLALGADI